MSCCSHQGQASYVSSFVKPANCPPGAACLSLQSLLTLLVLGLVCKIKIGEPIVPGAGEMGFGKGFPGEKPGLAIDLFAGRGGLYVRCLWTTALDVGTLKTPAGANMFCGGTVHGALWQRREASGCHTGLASAVGSSAGHLSHRCPTGG